MQLFLDDRLIENQSDVRRVLHSPRPAEVAIQRDQPFEDSTMYDPVVMKDGAKFRMWHRANFNKPPFYNAYAESDDGVRWTKPELGLVEYDGSKANYLVVGFNSVVGQVFVEPDAPPAERYRMLIAIYPADAKAKRHRTLLNSADGLRWTRPEKDIVPDGDYALDTQSQAFWDRDRQAYALFTRMGPWRQVGRLKSGRSSRPFHRTIRD